MSKPTGSLGIAILGHYGNRNLGDEAIITAVIDNLRRERPNARLFGFSINPGDTTQRHGIPAFPIRASATPKVRARDDAGATGTAATPDSQIRAESAAWRQRLKRAAKRLPIVASALRGITSVPQLAKDAAGELLFLKQSYRNLKPIDVLLITGSNQLIDTYGGTTGFPYTLFKWSVLARLSGARLAYVSIGAGPLNARLSKVLIRQALRFSEYTSFRDEGSKALMRSLGYRGQCSVYPDLAHSFSVETLCVRERLRCARPAVWINPMPIYDKRYWYVADADKYRAYVEKLTEFSSVLLGEGYPVNFFATQPKDSNVIADIVFALNGKREGLPERVTVKASESVTGLLEDIQQGSLIVASRFHGVLLSLLVGRPVVGICYQSKTRELMTDMGQGDYALDFETFSAQALMEGFKALEHNADVAVERLKERGHEHRAALRRQYKDIIALPDTVAREPLRDGSAA